MAGHTSSIRVRYDTAQADCWNYLGDTGPDSAMVITPEDISFEWAKAGGLRYRKPSRPPPSGTGKSTHTRLRRIPAKEALAKQVTFYRLHCNIDPDAARVAYETMTDAPKN